MNTATLIHQAFVPTFPWLSSAGFHLSTKSAGRSLIHPSEKPENRAGIHALWKSVASLQMHAATRIHKRTGGGKQDSAK